MPDETYHFSPFSLSPGVGLLFRDGAPVSLEPRAVKVLAYLVRSRGRVVPKGELLDKVWSDVFTTDAVLKQAVSQIRRALGDAAERPRYIQTFHARGYQFIAPVSVEAEVTEGAAGAPGPVAPPAKESEGDAVTTPSRAATRGARGGAGPNYDLLVGREKELSLLRAEYGRVLGGAGQPVVVRGEPGIGKTAHGARQLRREGVSDVAEQEPDGVRALSLEPARESVAAVVQGADGAQNRLARLGADVAVTVDDARDGHRRDARGRGDVGERGVPLFRR